MSNIAESSTMSSIQRPSNYKIKSDFSKNSFLIIDLSKLRNKSKIDKHINIKILNL